MSPFHQNDSLKPKHRLTTSVSRLFVPTLLCLALFPESFALASTGGEVDKPSVNDYGNVTKMSENDMVIDSNVTGNVYGAYNDTQVVNVEKNTVTIENGVTVGGNVHGAYTSQGNASNNTVTVNGATVGNYVHGGETNAGGNANGNIVTVNTGGKADRVFGGFARTGNANGNTVTLNEGAAVREILVGGNVVSGGDANGNTVMINGGTSFDVAGGYSFNGNASGNTVTIDHGTILASVYAADVGTPTSIARDNRVTLANGTTVTMNVGIKNWRSSPNVSNNWLIVQGKDNSARQVEGIDRYRFVVDQSVRNNDTMLSLTGTTGENTDLRGSPIELNVTGPALKSVGDKVTLINMSNPTPGSLLSDQTHATGKQGVAVEYDYALTNDANKTLTVTVTGVKLSEQSKAPSESRLAGVTLINQGMDLAADLGMQHAKASIKDNNNVAAFGALAGGSSTYHTGSSVKLDGVVLMAGVGRTFNTASGDLTGGVFFEAGYGDFNTHNNFSSGTVKGSGDTKYYGAGLMARYDVTTTALKGSYLEGSLHVGRVKTDWDSSDMLGSSGKVNNDTSNMYYGLHAGLGYMWNLTNQANLDMYGKYYWSHQGSDRTKVAGDPYHFDSTDSHRTRVGGRLNLNLTETVRPYIGAAWEHEFDGESNAQAYGLDLAAPTLKGDSGIFELGFSFKPAKNDNVSFNLGLQAFTGVREGVAGTAQFQYKF